MLPPDQPSLPIPRWAQPLVAAGVILGAVACGVWFVAAGRLVHYEAAPTEPSGFTVNLNAAGARELAQLPGLGPATAERIVEHRRLQGPFTSHDGLLAVPGIGPVTLDAVRPYLRPIRPSPKEP